MHKSQVRPEDYIYKLLKNKIIKKELFPNCQIIESQLVKETSISRTPIRTALKRLNYEGMITIVPNHGAFVSTATVDEIKGVYECKKLLESASIRLSCINITDEQLHMLDELLKREIETHVRRDFYQFIKVNTKFHLLIAKASKNICYEKFIAELITKSNMYLIFYDNFIFTSADNSCALQEHTKIVKSLKERNVNACVEAIERHNQITLDQLSLNGIIPY